MIDDIRNWLGDMASGKIKDAHLALTQARLDDFRRQLDQLVAERDDLLAKVRVLERSLEDVIAERGNLSVKLEERDAVGDRLNEKEEQVLRLFFDEARELSAEYVASKFPWPRGEVDHFITDLHKLKFIVMSRLATRGGIRPVQSLYSRGGSRGPTPAMYKINHPGSSYLMKNG